MFAYIRQVVISMIIETEQVWKDKLTKTGNSYAVIFNRDMMDYLGIDEPENARLIFKADKGSHGKFIGIGIER